MLYSSTAWILEPRLDLQASSSRMWATLTSASATSLCVYQSLAGEACPKNVMMITIINSIYWLQV